MKLVKPMAVSFSFRAFLMLGKQRLSVTSLVGFALGEEVRRLISDIVLWPAIGEVTGGVIDEGLPKPRGEVLVYGSCHTPGAQPLPVSYARMRVGVADPLPDARGTGVDKKLAVFGDRYWAGTAARGPSSERVPHSHEASDPLPFTEMPLGWERAFGGEGYPENPLGRGMSRIPVGDDIERLPLPNIELAQNLVSASTQRPEPAGFGPLDVSWPQRRSKAGTYDAHWLQEDFPGYARDTDPSFFSTAPPDQRIDGFFRGDEEYLLENMHPTHAILHGRLPGVAARTLVRRKGENDVEDVAMRLDTVVFLPGMRMGVLVFRGTTEIVEDDAADVSHALAACEDLDAPRSTDHYRGALESRLDKDKSGRLALYERDLLPSFASRSGLAGLIKAPEADGLKVKLERSRARVRKELVEAGVDNPDEVLARAAQLPPGCEALAQPPDFTDPESVDAFEKALEALDAHTTNQVQEARLETQKLVEAARRDGASLPENVLDGGAPGQGPPVPQTPQQLATFRDAGIEPDPTLVEKLHSIDAMALKSYREMAHYMGPAPALSDDARHRARIRMTESLAQGRNFAALDCTRQDLSELDLRKANFRNALLEGADLERANVAGVDMSGAVLAHATLLDTRFDGANLEGANLGSAMIDGATFVGANLRKAIFARAKLRSASFKEADLTGIDWLEAELGAVDFEAALAPKIDFFPGGALTRCRFPRARLKKANFLERKVDGVDFSEADLELVTFLKVTADGANFRKACLQPVSRRHGVLFRGSVLRRRRPHGGLPARLQSAGGQLRRRTPRRDGSERVRSHRREPHGHAGEGAPRDPG